MAPPLTSRTSVRTRQRQLLAEASNGLGFMASQALTQAFAKAVSEAGATSSRQLLTLAGVFQRVQTDRNARAEIHRRIAKLAQTSTVQAYGRLVTAREGPASRTHYRAGSSRMAAGKMLEALEHADFVEYGPDGINFANTALLDRIAAQWHRLNFGAAGTRQGSRPATFQVRFNNLVVATLGFAHDDPSPAFSMPRGIFLTPEGERVPFGANPPGSDIFQPVRATAGSPGGRRRASRQTAGIAAKNFFDAGLRRIATEIGPAYQQYYARLFERAKQGQGPVSSEVLVNPRRIPVHVDRI